MPESRLATQGQIPTWLTESRLLKNAPPKPLQVPDCPHGCQLDPFKTEGGKLVVTCPNDPPCFEGTVEISEDDAQFFTIDTSALVNRIAAANGLKPTNPDLFKVEGCRYCGVRAVREMWAYIYLAAPDINPSLLYLLREAHSRHREHRVLLLHGLSVDAACAAAARQYEVTLHRLPQGGEWDFTLPWMEVADRIDPLYLTDRHSNNNFIYEDVIIELACIPGRRHIVQINGAKCRGFDTSDIAFSRLLLLAAHRKRDANVYFGGWVSRDDVHIDDKNRRLDILTQALTKCESCGLELDDLTGLIRTNPEKDKTLRLALDPTNIIIAPSILNIRPINDATVKAKSSKPLKPGQQEHRENMKKAVDEARKLFRQAIQILKNK